MPVRLLIPPTGNTFAPCFASIARSAISAKNLKNLDVSGGLALDTIDGVKKGSNRPILAAGKAEQSLLYQLVTTGDLKKRMPLDARPLPAETIALLKRWIDGGAKEGKAADMALDPIVAKKSTTAQARRGGQHDGDATCRSFRQADAWSARTRLEDRAACSGFRGRV